MTNSTHKVCQNIVTDFTEESEVIRTSDDERDR